MQQRLMWKYKGRKRRQSRWQWVKRMTGNPDAPEERPCVKMMEGQEEGWGIRGGSPALPPHMYLVSREATRRDEQQKCCQQGELHFLKCKGTGKANRSRLMSRTILWNSRFRRMRNGERRCWKSWKVQRDTDEDEEGKGSKETSKMRMVYSHGSWWW